jgi:hypothetical protein
MLWRGDVLTRNACDIEPNCVRTVCEIEITRLEVFFHGDID